MRKKKYGYILLLVPITVTMVLILSSMVTVILQSLGYVPAFGLENFSLSYYSSILKDDRFISSLLVSLKIAVLSSVIAAVLGTLLCAAITGSGRKTSSALLLLRIPVLVPHAVVAIFMITIFSQTGILARISYSLGIISDSTEFPQMLYTDSYIGVILAYLWKEIPFVAYFTFALMASIKSSLGEAAENLGASPLKSFFFITLPLSMPAILNSFFIVLIFAFGAYELPFLLGSTLPKALPVETYISFSSPELRDRPYSMAMNGVILFISLAISLLYLAVINKTVRKLGGRK